MLEGAPMALDEKGKERLAALRDERAKKEKAEAEAAEERELASEELALVLEQALGGPLGEAFAIVNNRFGVFGLRKPDAGGLRKWERAKDSEKESLEWMIGFLGPYIEPTEKCLPWKQTCAERPGLCWQTANA